MNLDGAEEHGALSLSKGIFLHKKRDHAEQKKHKKSAKIGADQENWLSIKDSYCALWNSLKKEIQTVQNDCYHSIVENVITFMKNIAEKKLNTASIFNAIPTAAIIMGVNMPDHSAIFRMLEKKLHEAVTPFVARVQSKDCVSIANMVQKIVHYIIKMKCTDEDSVSLKRHNYTFEMLNNWYSKDTTEKNCPSPTKRSKKAPICNEKNPIVIVIEDMESFKSSVLQDFILICNNYVTELPLILVLGVATAMVTVHNLLPQKVTSCLAIETFSSAPATEYLGQIFQKVIMNPTIPFKLGPEVFQMIVDITLFHDFSLSNLQHILKFTVLEHFCSKPCAVLCSMSESTKSIVDNMSSSVIEDIAELPSVNNFLENMSPDDAKKLACKKKFNDKIISFTEDLNTYQKNQLFWLKCLHCVVGELPGYPLGKQMRDLYVYALALEQPISETAEYQKTLKLLGMLSREELESRLQNCIQVLKNPAINKEESSQEWLQNMEDLLSVLNSINSEQEVLDDEKEVLTPINFGKRVSRAELKEKLKDLASKKKKTKKFDIWRCDVVTCWDNMFSKLKSPLSFPLYEAFYFTDAALLKRHILAAPKANIHRTLLDPHSILQCKCCKLADIEDIERTLPPIAILYKLHLETGNLINVSDWLQSYQVIRRNNERRKSSNEEILQAEFFQAMSELQLLGVIKTTRRKTDHVARLTWGYC